MTMVHKPCSALWAITTALRIRIFHPRQYAAIMRLSDDERASFARLRADPAVRVTFPRKG